MKRPTAAAFLSMTILSSLCAFSHWSVQGATKRGAFDHGFSVKEYEEFHDVLHPLEHEALPRGDFKTIRVKGGELVKRGQAILKLGVPRNVKKKNVEEFKGWLQKFEDALARFKTDCGDGTDDQLKKSYGAVHDSFEMLAALLPISQ